MEQFNVTGMSCAACSARVEKAVKSVPGVTGCSVSLLTNSMGVEGTAENAAIIRAVEQAGYGAIPKKAAAAASTSAELDALADHETPKLKRRLIASLGFLLVLMYLSMGHMMWGWHLPRWFDGNHIAMGLVQLLLAGIVMVINQKFFISGFKGLVHRSPNMDTLVAMGSMASFVWSTYALFAMTDAQMHGNEELVMHYMMEFYFESAAMILTLITVGKMLEARSKGKTTDALKSLMKLAPKTATLLRDGAEVTVPIEQADGGLFVPERIPQADMAVAERLAGESYAALAGYLAALFFGEDIDAGILQREIGRIYDFQVPLRPVGSRYTLELFHGPTFAFKDFGAGFMGRMVGLLGGADEKLVILTATSGDTGSAVAHGFYNVPGVEVVLLYPEGKISRLQECQMTALGGNIHPLRVAGTFDDCQRLVKELFADSSFRAAYRVSSANSINLLRWIPQAFYYFYGYFRWRQASGGENPVVVVPSGNYGNLSAGMLARRMGLPLGGFVAASNANDVVPEFLRTGDYRPRPSVRTPANAMDVGAPSNFERMMWLCGGDADALRGELQGFRCDDAMIRRTIDGLYRNYGYLSDPHSAVGYAASVACGRPGFYLSTAHPAKFGEVISPVTGAKVPLPPRLAELVKRPRVSEPMAVDLGALEEYVAGVWDSRRSPLVFRCR